MRGWSVRARTAPIISSTLMDQYSEQLGGVLTLPEILFGNSSLQLRHEASGVVLSFTALDALKQWKADNLAPLKVNVAREWQAARLHEIEKQQAVVLEYDWTYTTSYAGSLSWCPPLFTNAALQPQQQQLGASDGMPAQQQQPEKQQSSVPGSAVPSTNHHPASGGSSSSSVPVAAAAHCQTASSSSSSRALPQWQPSTRQIDRRMLMCKDEPILFYAEVPLYESELDDNGVCQLSVKVRPGSIGF